MGSVDHGLQEITHEYYEDATASEFNKRNLDLKPVGIYSGGHLTKVTNSEVILTLFTLEIQDGTMQISSKSSVNATLNNTTLDSGTISSSTPHLVLRWAYTASQSNYVEVHAIASVAAAGTYDIIIGKCVFDGAVLQTTFDYSDRTLLNVQDVFLRVEATETTEMKVWVRGGRIQTSSQTVVIAEQKVGNFAVPGGSNSRIDLVYVDTDGTLAIQQGTAAVSPSAPDYGGKLVLAEVRLVNGDSDIEASRITDVRSFISEPIGQNEDPFGTWTDRDSLGNILLGNLSSGSTNRYQAIGSGFLVVKCNGLIYPKIRHYVKLGGIGSYIELFDTFINSGGWPDLSATIPVGKDDIFYINTDRSDATFQIYWKPFGNAQLVKQ